MTEAPFRTPTLRDAKTVRLRSGFHRRVLAVSIRPADGTAAVKILCPDSGLPTWVQVIGPRVAGTITDYYFPQI